MILTEENGSPKAKVYASSTLSITYSTAMPEIKPGIVEWEAKIICNLLKYEKIQLKPRKVYQIV